MLVAVAVALGGVGAARADDGVEAYPRAAIDRPRVLPRGMMEARLDLALVARQVTVVGDAVVSTAIEPVVGVRYGALPAVDAEVSYAFSLKDLEPRGVLRAGVRYRLRERGRVRLAARVATGYHVLDEAFGGVGLGVDLQWRLAKVVAITTPGDQLVLGFADGMEPVALRLPIGVSVQAAPAVALFAQTVVAVIAVAPAEASEVIGRDRTPLVIGGAWSRGAIELGLACDVDDVGRVADRYALRATVALRR